MIVTSKAVERNICSSYDKSTMFISLSTDLRFATWQFLCEFRSYKDFCKICKLYMFFKSFIKKSQKFDGNVHFRDVLVKYIKNYF